MEGGHHIERWKGVVCFKGKRHIQRWKGMVWMEGGRHIQRWKGVVWMEGGTSHPEVEGGGVDGGGTSHAEDEDWCMEVSFSPDREDGRKSTLLKTAQLEGQIPAFANPLTAVAVEAAFV